MPIPCRVSRVLRRRAKPDTFIIRSNYSSSLPNSIHHANGGAATQQKEGRKEETQSDSHATLINLPHFRFTLGQILPRYVRTCNVTAQFHPPLLQLRQGSSIKDVRNMRVGPKRG